MTAKIYHFPKTFDGRCYCICVIHTPNERHDGRDWDREAARYKRAFYDAERLQRAVDEELAAMQIAEEAAQKIVPFKRVTCS